MINSIKKGKRGEREWAKLCRDHGFLEVRRSQQYCGSADSADCVGLPGIHQEVKLVENLNINKAMEQSKKDSAEDELSIVAHKKNHKEWLVTMYAEDWFKLYNR